MATAKHERQLLREAVVAQLMNKTAAEDRVHPMRFVTYRGLELPALGVYIQHEDVDPASKDTAPRELTRTPQLVIEGVVKFSYDAIDKDLDALALEVEQAVDADPNFTANGETTASDSVLLGTDLDVLVEGETMVGVVKLTYSVVYRTDAPRAADVALDDLKTVDIKTSLGGAQAEADRAEDKLQNLDQE